MNTLLFLLLTYIMGFAAAIPVGATQIEIAKRSLNDHLRSAYLVVTGSVLSDIMYGFIALFGIAPILKSKNVIAVFDLISALILWLLALLAYREGKKSNTFELKSSILKNGKVSLVTGFSLAVTNPMMILWWLIGTRIIKDLGLVDNFNTNTSILFVVAGGIGIASYLSFLSYILHWAKKFISDKMIKKVNFGLVIVLILLSFYFLFNSLHTLL